MGEVSLYCQTFLPHGVRPPTPHDNSGAREGDRGTRFSRETGQEPLWRGDGRDLE